MLDCEVVGWERVGRLSADVTEGDKQASGTAADGARIDCAQGARAPHDLYRCHEKPGKPAENPLRWRCDTENKDQFQHLQYKK